MRLIYLLWIVPWLTNVICNNCGMLWTLDIVEVLDSETNAGKNVNDRGLNKTFLAQMLHTYFHPVFVHLKKMTRMCKYLPVMYYGILSQSHPWSLFTSSLWSMVFVYLLSMVYILCLSLLYDSYSLFTSSLWAMVFVYLFSMIHGLCLPLRYDPWSLFILSGSGNNNA